MENGRFPKFFDFQALFLRVSWRNRQTGLFFWVLWRPNMRNGRPPLSHATSTPTQKNPKHGYLNMEKGRFPIFFYFLTLFLRFSWRNQGTGLLFSCSLTFKHEKWPPSIVSRHWHTHEKKSQTWVLDHGKGSIFYFFFIFRLCFYVIVDGTGERDYFYFVLWRPNMINGRPPWSHATGTPTQKNPKHG